MPKRVVEITIELPSISFTEERSYSESNRKGGTFKLKRSGNNIEIIAPCGERAAKFTTAALTDAVRLVSEDTEVPK